MIFKYLHRTVILIALLLQGLSLNAQSLYQYRKSSLYSVMLKHDELEYIDELVAVFNDMRIPETFYDHSLAKRVFNSPVIEDSENIEDDYLRSISNILYKNAIGQRVVAKWFNQSRQGTFDLSSILKKGYDNVTGADISLSEHTIRGHRDLIANAGLELIPNTYVLVNDIYYGDKRDLRERRMNALSMVSLIPFVGSAVGGMMALANDYSGFKVTVTSYLYRLDWDESIADGFYSNYYSETPNSEKAAAFKKDKDMFKLVYLGSKTVTSSKADLSGVNDRETALKKVTTRAIDNSIADLMKSHPEFRVKAPLISTTPIRAQIGVREGITSNSKFEVLEIEQDEFGNIKYNRVATIQPIKDKIWDNRFMAETDIDNKYSSLNYTEFKLINGKIDQDGLLIREIYNNQ